MRILQRVPIGKEHTVQKILNFIAYANPNLEIPVLREALSVPEQVGKDDALHPRSIIRESAITKLCRSLIRKSNDGCHYEFAHFSVQEFLEGGMQGMPEFEAFQVSESICQLLLAKQCLKYLLLRNFAFLPSENTGLKDHLEMRIKQHPFYFYAAVCWPLFARTHWLNEGLVELAERLFQPKKTPNFIAWALELTTFAVSQYTSKDGASIVRTSWIHYRRASFCGYSQTKHTLLLLPQLVDKGFTTLHMAAALSLPVICSILIQKGGSIDQRSGFGCPLQCAVQGLYLAGVHEDDTSSFISPYFEANYWHKQSDSSEFGRANTMKLLLRSGATHLSACSSPFAGHTLITVAVQLALGMGNVSVISILLEAGYELEEDDLREFATFGQDLLEVGEYDEHDMDGVRSLVLCLSPMIDKSAALFRLCQAAWSLAIDMDCEFAQDSSVVDTRISHSQDALAKTIFTSVQDIDIETLYETLQDPRADIASLTDDRDNIIFNACLRHLRGINPLDGLNMLTMLLSAGMEVKRLSDDGLLPIHRLVESTCYNSEVYNDGYYDAALRDAVGEFVRKGTGCTARSRANQNVFHLGLRSIRLIKAILETETDENILTALRTRDDNGYTPIALAVQEGQEEVALLLLGRSSCDPEALQGPTSVLALCVTGGTHRAFNFLLDAAVGLGQMGCIKTTLLHHVSLKTSKEFVLQLIQMYPRGLLFRADGKLPIEAYFERCINCDSPKVDPDVLHLMAAQESEELDQREQKLVWENFTLIVQGSRSLEETYERSLFIDTRDEVTTEMITSLLQLGFVQSYEAVAHVAGVLPLLKPLRGDLDDLWPVSSEAICRTMKQTTFWEALRGSSIIIRLLKAAVKRCDVGLVELLVENGISVHQRLNEMSALEIACLTPAVSPDAKQTFEILLDHADESRLDEVNPYRGQGKGLIHYLAGPGKQWQLEKLLDRGVDINTRTSIHDLATPAIVYHLLKGSSDSASTLLERGGNPTIADTCGMDAALAAACQGDLAFLLHLHEAEGQVWQLDWQRTFSGCLIGTGDVELDVAEINALHLAAWDGQCDALRFYVEKGLLTDLNTVSSEGLTPMHLAAFNGQIDAVKLLYSRGGGLGLKSTDGSLPLHLAVRNEHAEVVKFLVENRSVMDTDIRGMSPLGYAMQLHNHSIIDCLCTTKQFSDYQSRPERREKDIIYAYERALMRGDVKDCELLRSQGCPVNADLPGQGGRSALIMAIGSSNEELITWLLTNNATAAKQMLAEDGDVVSPLQAMIMRPGLNDLLPLLLQRYQIEGGSAVDERPSVICLAVRHDNTIGLKMLLDHLTGGEMTNP